MMGQRPPPTGFELALPQTWEVVERPRRESVHITFGDTPVALAGASSHLRKVEKADHGTCLRARYLDVVGAMPAEAELTIGFYSIGTTNDPAAMMVELSDGGLPDQLELVELPAGVAVRRAGRRAGSRLVHQFYLPVPGTLDEVAYFGFSSPTVEREAQLRELFDAVGRGLSFTWSDQLSARWESPAGDESETTAAVPTAGSPGGESEIAAGAVLRSALSGWPGRFRPLAHLAVGLWALAAVAYAGQAVAALVDGATGLALWRAFRAVPLALSSLVGYLLDRPRWGGKLVLWAAFGLLFAVAGLTCPEATPRGHVDC